MLVVSDRGMFTLPATSTMSAKPKRAGKRIISRKDLLHGEILAEAKAWTGDLGREGLDNPGKIRRVLSELEKATKEEVRDEWFGYFVCRGDGRAYAFVDILGERAPIPMKISSLAWPNTLPDAAKIREKIESQELGEGEDRLSWERLQALGLTIETERGTIPIADTRHLAKLCPSERETGRGSDKRSACSSIDDELAGFQSGFEIGQEHAAFEACADLEKMDPLVWEKFRWVELAGKSPPTIPPREWTGMAELTPFLARAPPSLLLAIPDKKKKKAPKASSKRKAAKPKMPPAAKKQKVAKKQPPKKQPASKKKKKKQPKKKQPEKQPSKKKKASKRKRTPAPPKATNKKRKTLVPKGYALAAGAPLFATLQAARAAFIAAQKWEAVKEGALVDVDDLAELPQAKRWGALTLGMKNVLGASKAKPCVKLALSMAEGLFTKSAPDDDLDGLLDALSDEAPPPEDDGAPWRSNPLAAAILGSHDKLTTTNPRAVETIASQWHLDEYTEPEKLFDEAVAPDAGLTVRERLDFLLNTFDGIFPRAPDNPKLTSLIEEIY